MPGNYHAGGTADDTIVFDKPIGHLNINVGASVTFSISLDKGENYMTLPSGFHQFPVSPISEIRIQSSGAWQLIAVQS